MATIVKTLQKKIDKEIGAGFAHRSHRLSKRKHGPIRLERIAAIERKKKIEELKSNDLENE